MYIIELREVVVLVEFELWMIKLWKKFSAAIIGLLLLLILIHSLGWDFVLDIMSTLWSSTFIL